jgi:hypothetical protein
MVCSWGRDEVGRRVPVMFALRGMNDGIVHAVFENPE